MNKEELIEIIAVENEIPKTKAKAVLNSLISAVQKAVVEGDKVTLSGFGIFEAINTKARTGHNPRTKEKIKIDAKRRPKFTAGRDFKASVASGIITAGSDL